MSTTNKTVTGARKAVRNELWVGIIPDIFGYGFSVAFANCGRVQKGNATGIQALEENVS
jgi:hypothetical protein